MVLDRDICYRALLCRDARFDGRFFTAVKTTGVYCRPICPARMPLLKNVEFYLCAAAAEEAGYRPCLRCRPEASPAAPLWQGTAATVARALRLIGDGALDRGGVETLAETLGMGARHLRRLFMRHLGATPLAIAQTRRLHFARRLIDETALPLADVAFSAGYASTRRFNAAFKTVYGQAPGSFRRAKVQRPPAPQSYVDLHLTYRPPLDWSMLLGFLTARAIPGVESVSDGVYRRSLAVRGVQAVIEVSHAAKRNALLLRVPLSLAPHLAAIAARIRRQFDLQAAPQEILARLAADPLLEGAVQRHPGIRLPGAWDPFELAVRAIIGQQVSVKGATTVAGRLVKAFGKSLEQSKQIAGISHLFPDAARLAQDDILEFRGMPRARSRALRSMAQAVRDGKVALDGSLPLEELEQRLTALPGIGPWTANYIAMRAVSEPDAFPAGDLALKRAAANGGAAELSERQLLQRAEGWRPWRAYAALLLWADYAAGQAGG